MSLPTEPKMQKSAIGLIRLLAGVMLFAALIAGAVFAVSRASPHFFQVPTEVSASFALKREGLLCAVVLLATFAMAWIERRSIWYFGLAGERNGLKFVQGAITGIAFLSVLIACLATTNHLSLHAESSSFSLALRRTPLWVLCFFIVALTEEVVFRGYLQTMGTRLVGFWPMAAVLSLFFGMVHLRNDGEAAIGIIVVVLGGALFSVALKRTGSLWWGIGFHTAWDWGQSFLFGTRDSGILIQDRLLQSTPLGSKFWSGGAIGPEGSAFVIPVFILALCFAIFTLRGDRPGPAIAA